MKLRILIGLLLLTPFASLSFAGVPVDCRRDVEHLSWYGKTYLNLGDNRKTVIRSGQEKSDKAIACIQKALQDLVIDKNDTTKRLTLYRNPDKIELKYKFILEMYSKK